MPIIRSGANPENPPEWRCTTCNTVWRTEECTMCNLCISTGRYVFRPDLTAHIIDECGDTLGEWVNSDTSPETRTWQCTTCYRVNSYDIINCESLHRYCCQDCTNSTIRPDQPNSNARWLDLEIPEIRTFNNYWDNLEIPEVEDDYDDYLDPDDCELIHGYSYKPRPKFHGMSDSGLFLGFELELNIPSESSRVLRQCAELSTEYLGRLGYLKSDSSIPYGFEVVTHPMTYEYALNSFPWTLLSELNHLGMESDDECGLHVHVSRQGFSNDLHSYRWLKFVYRNSRQWTKLSRRDSHWGQFRTDERKDIRKLAKPLHTYDVYPERYSAVNCSNDTTYEIRTFKSTLDKAELQACLGLSDATIEYTRKLTANDIVRKNGWMWESFRKSLTDKYQPLIEVSDKLGI